MVNEISDLVALLSEYEAHPIAVMEALALQRPVLVADTSGLREIAEQGLARAVSLQSTPEEIARAVLQQIEEPLVPPAHFELPTWDDCTRQLQAIYNVTVGKAQWVPRAIPTNHGFSSISMYQQSTLITKQYEVC